MAVFFSHVYGQGKVKKELKRLYDENRLPHTLIFMEMRVWERPPLPSIWPVF